MATLSQAERGQNVRGCLHHRPRSQREGGGSVNALLSWKEKTVPVDVLRNSPHGLRRIRGTLGIDRTVDVNRMLRVDAKWKREESAVEAKRRWLAAASATRYDRHEPNEQAGWCTCLTRRGSVCNRGEPGKLPPPPPAPRPPPTGAPRRCKTHLTHRVECRLHPEVVRNHANPPGSAWGVDRPSPVISTNDLEQLALRWRRRRLRLERRYVLLGLRHEPVSPCLRQGAPVHVWRLAVW